ncbi:unnamed protein product [Calypogeia fissa]
MHSRAEAMAIHEAPSVTIEDWCTLEDDFHVDIPECERESKQIGIGQGQDHEWNEIRDARIPDLRGRSPEEVQLEAARIQLG